MANQNLFDLRKHELRGNSKSFERKQRKAKTLGLQNVANAFSSKPLILRSMKRSSTVPPGLLAKIDRNAGLVS